MDTNGPWANAGALANFFQKGRVLEFKFLLLLVCDHDFHVALPVRFLILLMLVLLFPLVLIFFGLIFFIPAFFYKSDIKHKTTEIALVASNHLLPGQKLVNTNKRAVKWSLTIVFLVLFLLAFIAVGLILLAILSTGGGGYMA